MAKAYLNLQQSEAVVVRAAADIFASYVIAGKVGDDNETQWLERSLRHAIRLAKGADDAIIAEGEME